VKRQASSSFMVQYREHSLYGTDNQKKAPKNKYSLKKGWQKAQVAKEGGSGEKNDVVVKKGEKEGRKSESKLYNKKEEAKKKGPSAKQRKK